MIRNGLTTSEGDVKPAVESRMVSVCAGCTGPPDFDGDGITDACDPDIDGDDVPNDTDHCNRTPVGAQVDLDPTSPLYGTLYSDRDGDCDVDLLDYWKFVREWTGPVVE